MGKLLTAGKRVLTGESLFMTVFGNGGRQRPEGRLRLALPGQDRRPRPAPARRPGALPEGRLPLRRQGHLGGHRVQPQARRRPLRRRGLHPAEARGQTASPSSTPAAPSCRASSPRARRCASTPAAWSRSRRTVQYDIQMVSGDQDRALRRRGAVLRLAHRTRAGSGSSRCRSAGWPGGCSRRCRAAWPGARARARSSAARRPGDGRPQLSDSGRRDDEGREGECGAGAERRASRSGDRRFDLEHAAPGHAQVLGQVELGEDLAHLVAGHVGPDVVPLRVAQQVGDRPGAPLGVPWRGSSAARRGEAGRERSRATCGRRCLSRGPACREYRPRGAAEQARSGAGSRAAWSRRRRRALTAAAGCTRLTAAEATGRA